MKGTSFYRRGGPDDPLVNEIKEKKGLDEVPQFRKGIGERKGFNVHDYMQGWMQYVPRRDGPVNRDKPEGDDPAVLTELIRNKGMELGASDMGFAELTPIMLIVDAEFDVKNIVCILVAEDYSKVLGGATAIEREAYSTYVECARISTELAEYIRGLGFPAVADHNGTGDVMAIPALYQAGFGELGRHGSLIHRELGPSFRPSFVLTDAPVEYGSPDIFGVQKTCETCRICEQNCPPGAIRPAEDFIETEGVKRWLVDTATCYEVSRFREQYCHICVDVCPYQHKMTKNPDRMATYKSYLQKRKKAGYKTPAWYIEDEDQVLAGDG